MKKFFWFGAVSSALLFATAIVGLSTVSSTSVFADQTLPNTAIPENRDGDKFRRQVSEMEKGNVDLLWVGDSITDFWDNAGRDVWQKYYVDRGRNPLNFGISGDRTSQVIWRIDNAPMDKIAPKMAVVMIGTNNLAHGSTPADTVVGITAIVDRLGALYPDAKILLLEIFPRGPRPDSKYRDLIEDANARLRAIYGSGQVPNVQLYGIGDLFLDGEGNLSEEIMPDFLHPGAKGYEIWAEAIEPMVMEGLGDSPETVQPKRNLAHDDRYTNQCRRLEEKKDFQILMFGDSIVGTWLYPPTPQHTYVWDKYYGSKGAMNLGVGGDIVSGTAWRFENYPLDGVNPKLIIIEVGVNDLTSFELPKEDVAFGIRTLVKKMHARWPKARVIAMGCLPFQFAGNPNHDAMTYQSFVDEYNRVFPLYFRDLPYVTTVDISDLYLFPDGTYNPQALYDAVHPTTLGCALWGERLNPLVEKLLKEYDDEE